MKPKTSKRIRSKNFAGFEKYTEQIRDTDWLAFVSERLPGFCALVLITAAAIAILSYQLDRPWIGHHDFNGAVWSNIARNFNRYGFIATKLGQVNDYGQVSSDSFSYYVHHPPLLPVLLALTYRFFGEVEVVGRTLMMIMSIGTLVWIFLIARHYFGLSAATIAASSLLVIPQWQYFGKMVDHEVPALFFITGGAYFYIRFREQAGTRRIAGLLLMITGAGLTAWPAYFFMLAIFIADILMEKRVRREIMPIPLIGIGLLIGFMAHSSILIGPANALQEMKHVFLMRTGQTAEAAAHGFTLTTLFERIEYCLTHEFTVPILFASAAGFTLLLLIRNPRVREYLYVTAALMTTALLHLVVFVDGTWNHDYWFYYLLTPLALAIGGLSAMQWRKPIVDYGLSACALLALVLAAYQGLPTIKNMYGLDLHYNYQELGGIVNDNSSLSDVVMTTIVEPGPQAKYYADRSTLWGISTVDDFQKALSAYRKRDVVFINGGRSADLTEYLRGKYPAERSIDYKLETYRIPATRR